jgi:hypothetical protein
MGHANICDETNSSVLYWKLCILVPSFCIGDSHSLVGWKYWLHQCTKNGEYWIFSPKKHAPLEMFASLCLVLNTSFYKYCGWIESSDIKISYHGIYIWLGLYMYTNWNNWPKSKLVALWVDNIILIWCHISSLNCRMSTNSKMCVCACESYRWEIVLIYRKSFILILSIFAGRFWEEWRWECGN